MRRASRAVRAPKNAAPRRTRRAEEPLVAIEVSSIARNQAWDQLWERLLFGFGAPLSLPSGGLRP